MARKKGVIELAKTKLILVKAIARLAEDYHTLYRSDKPNICVLLGRIAKGQVDSYPKNWPNLNIGAVRGKVPPIERFGSAFRQKV